MKAVQDLYRIAEDLRVNGALSADSLTLQNIASHIGTTEVYVQKLKEEARTLRDQFAAAALTGMLASWDRGNAGRLFDMQEIAADAFCMADEMMCCRTPKAES